jgi:hypothetical protein
MYTSTDSYQSYKPTPPYEVRQASLLTRGKPVWRRAVTLIAPDIVHLSQIGLRRRMEPATGSLTNQLVIAGRIVCSGSNFR